MNRGRTIRMFLVDGVPTGIIAAEIMNWTGHVLSAPRSRLADLIQRKEAARTGVYFLAGVDPETGGKLQIYVGESDNVGKRLAQHNRAEESGGKDFWDRVCFVTSKDQNLTKGHVRYLESRLIAIAKDAGRSEVVNVTAPDYGYLPEADVSDMEFFVEQIRIVLPVLGLDFLRDRPKISIRISNAEAGSISGDSVADTGEYAPVSPVFEIVSDRHGLHAEAKEIGGDFVVLAGSKARASWVGDRKHNTHYWGLHDQLCLDGILVPDGDVRVFRDDYAFSSPSAAAAVVYGRSSNGRTSWKVKGGNKTYADLQEESVAAVAAAIPEE